nr:T9SS type A sorting domain-containing protein [Bacteroidota bacterium]
MKKTLLFLSMLIAVSTFAQYGLKVQPGIRQSRIPSPEQQISNDGVPINNSLMDDASRKARLLKSTKGTDFITIIPIGDAANSYSYGYNNGASTIVWADNVLNTVVNTHRMTVPPNSGNLAIDISMDGGLTWEVNREIYSVQYEEYRARYPQGALYNPAGNTDPNNAYLPFFSCSLDGSNGGDWGSYTWGSASIGDPTDTTVHYITSNLAAGYARGIPTAFEMTQQGVTYMADACLESSYVSYLGNIMVWRGTWDEETTDFVYEEQLVPVECDYARYLKMAFSPDGQIGYIYWNNENFTVPNMDGRSYPLLLRTTDGGDNWDDQEIISIEVSGSDGIEGIKNWLSDEKLIEIFGELPDRDDILYDVPYFNSDITIDQWGNPHLVCSVFLSAEDPGFIIIEPETFGVFDIFSPDGGETWLAHHLGTLHTYEGVFETDYNEYNRVQVASTMDGTKMFVTWNDTQLPGIEENTSPDIFARGVDMVNYMLTQNAAGEDAPDNVTEFSDAMWQAYFQVTARYVLEDNGVYTIPITYEDMEDPFDPGQPVHYRYISDFSYSDDAFVIPGINGPAQLTGEKLKVSQNYPNPANGLTQVEICLNQAASVNFEIFDIIGNKIYETGTLTCQSGIQIISFDVASYPKGVYFYKISSGNEVVTKKMIVE